MKKKIGVLSIMLFVALFSVGCGIVNADTTRDIRHSGFSVSSEEFECPPLLPSDEGYERIKWLMGSQAITTDGVVYLLSFSQKYSNDMNCMRANFTPRIVSIFDGKVAKANDGKIYYLVQNGESAAFSVVPSNDSSYATYKLLLDDSEVLKVITVDQNSGTYYVLKKDGNVYNYVVGKNNDSVYVVSSPVVYSKSNYQGEIVDFNYVGKSTGTFIRTNTQVFRMLATNKEECTKYADIACDYEMSLDEGLSKHLDKILGYNGSFLITTYGSEFSVAG